MNELSDLENKILDILVHDSSKTFAEIAKELKVSRQAVAYNVANLKEKGIIKRFTIDLNYEMIGIELPVIVLVKMEHVNIDTFKKIMELPLLKENSRVQDVFTLSGPYAFGIFGQWKNKEEYGVWKTEFIDEAKKIRANGVISLYELDEFVIWDFYKHRGVFEVPEHIEKYIKTKK